MREKNSMVILIGKRLLFFSVPLIAALYFFYEVIFGLDMSFSWMFASLYAAIIGLSTALNYKHMEISESIESFEKLEDQISRGRWDVVKKGEYSLALRPKFDFPYNKLSKDIVEVEYSNGSVKMSGPHYYLDKLSKDIRGKGSIWTKRATSVVTTLLILTIISIPILGETGMFWKIKMMTVAPNRPRPAGSPFRPWPRLVVISRAMSCASVSAAGAMRAGCQLST